MIKFNNETIKNAIMDALDKMERGIEVDRDELINVILKYGDSNFGIKNKDTGKDYTEEELQNSIYIHIFKNNKCYIGQTSRNSKDRWKCDGNGYCKGQVIYNAIKKYGWDNFSHIVLCYGLSEEEANEMEVALISLFKSTNREFGYNMQNGGNSVGKHSEETRNKMREARKGKYVGENAPMYGKHFSEESKKKMSEAKKGRNTVGNAGGNNPRAKRVLCDKMIFPTIKECAYFYNIHPDTMRYWLNTGKISNSELMKKGLRYATQDDINTYPLYIEEEQNQQDK